MKGRWSLRGLDEVAHCGSPGKPFGLGGHRPTGSFIEAALFAFQSFPAGLVLGGVKSLSLSCSRLRSKSKKEAIAREELA